MGIKEPAEWPQMEAIQAAAADHNLVALTVALPFDHETAITLADRFLGEDGLFLLESATAGPGQVARFTYLGFDPLWTYIWQNPGDTQSQWQRRGETELINLPGGDPILGLGTLMDQFSLAEVLAAGGMRGAIDVKDHVGAVGYFGYDTCMAIEPTVGVAPPKELGLPAAWFALCRNFMILDQLTSRLYVSVVWRDEQPADQRDHHLRAELSELKQLVKRLQAVHGPAPLEVVTQPLDYDNAHGSFDKKSFLAQAERCLEDIRQGEIFQVQIGNRLRLPTDARPFDIFRHLRALNPSPYMFYLKWDHHHIVGASPEMMTNIQGQTVIHRPIAGTRKRTWNAAKDALMRQELVSSEKERAEHVMLVDLSRNDIGRVAAPGAVRVEELMIVEEYSHVFHMVSQVTGDLAPGQNAFSALSASFPNGTVTGAPKIRAMQLIYEREPMSREFYAGCLGLFDFCGHLKSTLLIRTLYVSRGEAHTQASAGMVYDSIPEQEWLETRNKMAACLTAMQNTR